MTNGSTPDDDISCRAALAALASGGDATDWEAVERHLSGCADCAAGLERFATAIDEQFAAGDALTWSAVTAARKETMVDEADGSNVVRLPVRRAAPPRRPSWRRVSLFVGTLAAAIVVALGVAVHLQSGSGGNGVAEAGRLPQFVPSLQILPERADHTYFSGEQIQVCLTINQPSRIHLSVLAGHATFGLYDADTDPGQHCFPERVAALTGPATLRVEVFFGTERVAREDFPLQPASAAHPTASP